MAVPPNVIRALRVLVPTAAAAFVASRVAPWVISRTRPVVDAGRSKVRRTGSAASGRSNDRPLDELTKEQLYERAQAADIEGRSTMSKDELLRALKARN